MNFLSNLTKGDQSKPDSDKESSGGLATDAKLVAEAAQAPGKCDKPKVAGAAANLLDAASGYAKLDETKGVGKYVDQAEGYLRKYNSSGGAPAAEHKPDAPEMPAGEDKPVEAAKPAVEEKKEESSEGGFGIGDVSKIAGGFFNK